MMEKRAQEPQAWVCPDSAEHRYGKPGHCEDCGKTLVQMAEPVQEPVAWRFQSAVGGWAYGSQPPLGSKYPAYPLYTAPPRRMPLAEEEIEKAYREIWRNLPSDFDHTSAGWIELGIRYAEQAHGIGEHE